MVFESRLQTSVASQSQIRSVRRHTHTHTHAHNVVVKKGVFKFSFALLAFKGKEILGGPAEGWGN